MCTATATLFCSQLVRSSRLVVMRNCNSVGRPRTISPRLVRFLCLITWPQLSWYYLPNYLFTQSQSDVITPALQVIVAHLLSETWFFFQTLELVRLSEPVLDIAVTNRSTILLTQLKSVLQFGNRNLQSRVILESCQSFQPFELKGVGQKFVVLGYTSWWLRQRVGHSLLSLQFLFFGCD